MAQDVKHPIFGEPTQQLEPATVPSRSERARESAYRNRFVLVYFALAVVLGCAIGALVVGLSSSSKKTAKPRTVFQPSSSGELGAMDLAVRVQQRYRLPDGHSFVDVVASRNILQNGSFGFLRVRFQVIQPLDATKNPDTLVLQMDDAIQFSLCGAGKNCGIAAPATQSSRVIALLRRQGLELALRTFANDAQVDDVAVFLAPLPVPEGSSFEGVVLNFNRALIRRNNPGLLGKPVTTLLRAVGKEITPEQLTADDMKTINELTKPYLYLYRYQIVGGRDAVLDLQPLGF